MPSVFRSFLAAFLATALFGSNSRAENAEPAKIDTVIVTATPLQDGGVDRETIAAPLQATDGKTIANSHASDLGEFLNRRLSGVYINDVQSNSRQVDVNFRGYTASPLLGTPQGIAVYLDGVRLNQPFGDVVSFDAIPRAAIESMTLVPGSNPLFGLNALGGALSMHSKDGFSNAQTSVQAEYGNHAKRTVEFEHGANDGTRHWFVTGNVFGEDGWRELSASKSEQLFAKFGWRTQPTDISLSLAYSNANLRGNALQDFRLLSSDYHSVYTKPDITDNRSLLANIVLRHEISTTSELLANLYVRDLRTSTLNGDINEDSLDQNIYQPTLAEQAALSAAGYSGFPASGASAASTPFPSWRCVANVLLNSAPNEQCNALENRARTEQQVIGANAQWSLRGVLFDREQRAVIGAAIESSRADFAQTTQFGYLNEARFVIPVNGLGAFADGSQASSDAFDARVDMTGRMTTWSVYAADTVALSSTTSLTLSGRFNRAQVTTDDAISPGGGPGSLDGDHVFSRLNPAIGMTTVAKHFNAFVGYSESNRAPSAIELGCADAENPCKLPNAIAGDPPLLQVIASTWELGARALHDAPWQWHANIFRSDNRDDILFIADERGGFGYFANFGRTRRQGLELGVASRRNALEFGANYTYLDATYLSDEVVNGTGNSSNNEALAGNRGFAGTIDIEAGNRIPLIPAHSVKAFVEYDLTSATTFSADMLAMSRMYARGNENNQHRSDGVYYLGDGETPSYVVFNLGLDYRPSKHWKVFAQVNNIFDRHYYTAAQLGATGLRSDGTFIARPFGTPVIDGSRPLVHSTFYSPAPPRSFLLGVRYSFNNN